MTPHERVVINLSLKVREEALEMTKHSVVTTTPVRLALRTLMPHVAQRWPLEQFWSGAEAENPIGRFQSCNAALNGIRLQLKAKGRLPV